MSTFSQTVICGKVLRPWGTCAMPSRNRRSGRRPPISLPRNKMRPRRGRMSPEIVRSRVDLPAPFGPIRQTKSPASTSRSTPRRMSPPDPYPATSRSHWTSTSVSEVGIEDGGIGAYLRRRPARDHPTSVQHNHRLAQLHDKAHVVLDDQKRHAASVEVANVSAQPVDHHGVEPSSRFVEHEQLRLGHQSRRQLQQFLLPEGQAARRLVAEEADAKELQEGLSPLPLVTLDAGREEGAETELPDGHDHVLEHRHVLEDPRDLKGPGDAEMHDLVGSKPAQDGSSELHRPAIRSIKARHAIEKGRLARAIGADQRRDAPGFHLEA